MKDSNLQSSQKKQFPSVSKKMMDFLPVLLFSSLYGTYLDLYFVGKGLYSFPMRPLSDIFTINMAFTLIGLPLLTIFVIFIYRKVNRWKGIIFIVTTSLLMAVFEKLAESMGFFVHHQSWKHLYSFIGYNFYFILMLTLSAFIDYIKK